MALTTLFGYVTFFSLFICALWKPISGVLGYLAVYIIYDPKVLGLSFAQYMPRPSLIASIFLIIGALLHSKKLDWHFTRREIEFYLFLVLCWVSTFVFGTGLDDHTLEYVLKMAKLFLFIFFFNFIKFNSFCFF